MNERARQTQAILRARRAKARTRKKRIPAQLPPVSIEREYARALSALVAEALREAFGPLREALPAILERARAERADSVRIDEIDPAGAAGRSRRLIDLARDRLAATLSTDRLEKLAAQFGARTVDYQGAQLANQIRAALGTDIFTRDKALRGLLDGFAAENVALIKSIPERVASEIETATMRAIQGGTLHRDLAKELEERFAIGAARAKLIARDQIGKLYGQTNVARQKALGLERFTWRTVNDERVRSEHAEREGRVYSYDDPPEDGIPGIAINCRCYAEPMLDDLLGEDEG